MTYKRKKCRLYKDKINILWFNRQITNYWACTLENSNIVSVSFDEMHYSPTIHLNNVESKKIEEKKNINKDCSSVLLVVGYKQHCAWIWVESQYFFFSPISLTHNRNPALISIDSYIFRPNSGLPVQLTSIVTKVYKNCLDL
jgi:hypothetical protein